MKKNISISKILIKLFSLNLVKFKDVNYIKIIYYLTFHKKINLENPKTLNEKLQWLKLNDRQDIYTTMVDKYEAKQYINNIFSDEIIIPTLGIYNSFDEINFDSLPNEFVIKCTHDSGGLVVCKNKNDFNLKLARKKINKSLKTNYYLKWREWPYKNIKPRIIIEKYMGDNLLDYKLQCFNGKVDNILVCEGRNTSRGVRYLYFNKNWDYLAYCDYDDISSIDLDSLKPDNLDEMISIAEKLSDKFCEMRVDLYNINNKIYFGEITLYSDAGFDRTITENADRILGEKLNIRRGL